MMESMRPALLLAALAALAACGGHHKPEIDTVVPFVQKSSGGGYTIDLVIVAHQTGGQVNTLRVIEPSLSVEHAVTPTHDGEGDDIAAFLIGLPPGTPQGPFVIQVIAVGEDGQQSDATTVTPNLPP